MTAADLRKAHRVYKPAIPNVKAIYQAEVSQAPSRAGLD
jgi:hypothetical protein